MNDQPKAVLKAANTPEGATGKTLEVREPEDAVIVLVVVNADGNRETIEVDVDELRANVGADRGLSEAQTNAISNAIAALPDGSEVGQHLQDAFPDVQPPAPVPEQQGQPDQPNTAAAAPSDVAAGEPVSPTDGADQPVTPPVGGAQAGQEADAPAE